MISLLKRFFLMGIAGTIAELIMVYLSTVVVDLFTGHSYSNLATCSHTSILAIFVYGWATLPYDWLHVPMTNTLTKLFAPEGQELDKVFSLIVKGIIYGIIFTIIEYLCGAVSLYWFHNQAWDYRSLPLHTPDGLISLPTGLVWGILGVYGEYVYQKVLLIQKDI